jgi:hypothetical protein
VLGRKVRKFIGKISIGFDYWFTFILNPGVEPINNRAERIGVSPNANRKTSQLNICTFQLFNRFIIFSC